MATDIDEALYALDHMDPDEHATESESDDYEADYDEENTALGAPPMDRNTVGGGSGGRIMLPASEDSGFDDEIRRFIAEEGEMFVQAEQRLLDAMAAEDALLARDRATLLRRDTGGAAPDISVADDLDDPLGIDLVARSPRSLGTANADSPRQPDMAFEAPWIPIPAQPGQVAPTIGTPLQAHAALHNLAATDRAVQAQTAAENARDARAAAMGPQSPFADGTHFV
jgi:hypothetical protein